MREFRHVVAGEQVRIKFAENDDDLDQFRDFVRANLRVLAVDSETTGLDVYSAGFRMRLLQFGTAREAWVLPIEYGGRFEDDARRALRGLQHIVFHNGVFDLQAIERHLGVPMEELWPKVRDTKILAHLVDPRGRDEGGIGQSLEALTDHYIDADVAASVKGLMTKFAQEYKTTKAKIWAKIDLEHPEYLLYAGMDVILAMRLVSILTPRIPGSAKHLVPYEHEIAEICSYMERTGFLLDVEYTLSLSARLHEEEQTAQETAARYGCENVNSTEQVADVLEYRGVQLTGRTPTGKRQVDKGVLDALVKGGDEFARAVVDAKRAGKWRTTWVDKFLSTMDSDARCHPSINSLRARTARMSITGIPAQTLPSGDFMIRRCFVADEGHLIASIDYAGQELRVLAALARDRTMIKAFAQGLDLHLLTAQAAFGDHITKDDPERKYGKTTNFGRVYGGGYKTVAEQTGIPLETAKRVVDAFDRRYPGVPILSKKMQLAAIRNGHITTQTGRRLPVDRSRAYAALNYAVQSASRDVTCRGLIRLHKAGYTPYLRLPVHDEVVASLPAAKAAWGARQIADLMAEQMGPVHISTDAEVGLRSWGSLYGADY
ncbi:MAG: DNA polymerase [Umezawaea sp.]